MKKRLSLVLVFIMMALLLTGCGNKKPDGMYLGYDDYGSQMALLFDGDSLTISNVTYGVKTVGTYSISGKTLTYTTTVFGVTNSEQMSYEKIDDTVILNGTKYISFLGDRGPSLGFWIVIFVLVVGVYLFLKLDPKVARGLIDKVKNKTLNIDTQKVSDAAKKFTDSANVIGKRVASTVSASVVSGVEATKAAVRERNEARQNRLSDDEWEFDENSSLSASDWEPKQTTLPIRPDCCCICGGSLSEGKTRLFTVSSGEEAFICPLCHNTLYVLNRSNDQENLSKALIFAKSQLTEVDPSVKTVIQKFITIAESRMMCIRNSSA